MSIREIALFVIHCHGAEPGATVRESMRADYRLAVTTPSDAGAVTSLLKASYGSLMPASYDAAVLDLALPLMTEASATLLASGTYYVALDKKGLAIGSGGWTKERPGTEDVQPELAHIRHFATHPAWLGMGVGRSIYAECEKAAGAAGIKRFECYSSLNAERFYAALGFRAIRHMNVNMGPGISFPAVLMEASL
jgi:predicted N-acetyltransferase YhbS